jgi:hypothetical protein
MGAHAAEHDRIGTAQFQENLAVPLTFRGDLGDDNFAVIMGISPEEARATQVEGQIARELGEPVRQNYRDAGDVVTTGPTSRELCPNPSGGTCR